MDKNKEMNKQSENLNLEPELEFEKITKLIVELKNKNLELLAEMENLRKQQTHEKKDFEKYALTKFLKDLIPTIDMFDSVLLTKNVPEEVKNWLKGFEMINENIKKVFEDFGVKKINVQQDDNFDANLHFVIEENFSDQVEKDKIIREIQKGYKLHDRLIRPSLVIVSKGKENLNKNDVNNKQEKNHIGGN